MTIGFLVEFLFELFAPEKVFLGSLSVLLCEPCTYGNLLSLTKFCSCWLWISIVTPSVFCSGLYLKPFFGILYAHSSWLWILQSCREMEVLIVNQMNVNVYFDGVQVTECRLVVDPRTRESRGFGFVTMETAEDADRCIKYLNRSTLEGRIITVEKVSLY